MATTTQSNESKTMDITRDEAIKRIEEGRGTFQGTTREGSENGSWIISDPINQKTDHAPIDDEEPLCGCMECGTLVDPEDDFVGCGCHCPDCGSSL